jgi:hypothetical protein
VIDAAHQHESPFEPERAEPLVGDAPLVMERRVVALGQQQEKGRIICVERADR